MGCTPSRDSASSQHPGGALCRGAVEGQTTTTYGESSAVPIHEDAPSVDVSVKKPEAPSISGDLPSISGDLLSGEVSVTAPGVRAEGADAFLTAGLAAYGAAAGGGLAAALGLSGDKSDVEVPSGDVDASLSVPDLPSVEVKKPKKGLLGGLFGSSKAKMEVADVDASLPEVSGDVLEPDAPLASAAVLSQLPDVDADMTKVSGDVSVPDFSSAEVEKPKKGMFGGIFGSSKTKMEVSGDVTVPDVSGSMEAPSVTVSDKMPEAPSISGDLPSGEVSVTAPDVSAEGGDASLTAGLAAFDVAALGAIGGAIGLSGDKPDVEAPSGTLPSGDVNASLSVPDLPSADVKKPKKGLFGGIFGSSKGKMEVPDVDASLPEVSADVSAPAVSGEVSVPDVDVDVPKVSGEVSLPDVSGSVEAPSVDVSGKVPDVPSMAVDLPSGEVSVTAPDVSAEGGDASLTAGLAAGAAALGAIGAAVGLSGDKPDVEKPKKGMFGGIFGSSKTKMEAGWTEPATG